MPAMIKLSATSRGPVRFSLTWNESLTAKKLTDPADVAGGHDAGQLGRAVDPVPEGKGREERPQQAAHRADVEHQEHGARRPGDPEDVGAEQQQRDGRRHQVVPDDVVSR